MIVKLKTRMAGTDGNHAPTSTIEVSDEVGKQLIDGDYAVLIEASVDCEKPVAAVTKKATPSKGKGAK